MPHSCLPGFGVTVVLMSGSSPETVCAKMYQLHKMRIKSAASPMSGQAKPRFVRTEIAIHPLFKGGGIYYDRNRDDHFPHNYAARARRQCGLGLVTLAAARQKSRRVHIATHRFARRGQRKCG